MDREPEQFSSFKPAVKRVVGERVLGPFKSVGDEEIFFFALVDEIEDEALVFWGEGADHGWIIARLGPKSRA